MMKKQIYIILTLVFLYSCNEPKSKNNISGKSLNIIQLESEQEKLNLDINSDSILNGWVEYYKEKTPSFSITNFILITTDSLRLIKGNIYGSFDKEFAPIYKTFLIYNLSKKQYIDFDSYNWSIDDNGEPSFSPDQEINLVDIEKKSINRIAFRGPSQWVEDAFWKNDSIIVLLENNYDKQPEITEINLKNKLVRNFRYNDTLDFKTEYITERFKRKGISDE